MQTISRRRVVLGLAGLAALGAAPSWLTGCQNAPMVSAPTQAVPTQPTRGPALVVYRGHMAGVNAVAWSPDGGHIVSGSDDGTAQVWEAMTGKTLLTYNGQAQDVRAVVWSPDGTRIASGNGDSSVQVWDA